MPTSQEKLRLGIHANGFRLSLRLREYAEQRVDAALGCWADRIAAAMVFLEILDGAPHGLNHQCRVVVDLTSTVRLTAKARHWEPEVAVNRAVRRMARCLRSTLGRAGRSHVCE